MNIIFSIGGDMIIPTGIRCTNMPADKVLIIYPHSGLDTKYRLVPSNLTSIIDADYADSNNERHIFIKIVNDGENEVEFESGKAFCQGILFKYDITEDDECKNIRNG